VIDHLDEALREFLIRELPVRENEIDISFEQPRREWSARLNRPTLNLFLREIRENVRLRSPQPGSSQSVNGNVAVLQRQPVRVDLSYMATAWAKDPLDEHRILSRLLAALFRLRGVPDDLVAEHVPGQDAGVPMRMAGGDTTGSSASDMWSVLDNELRPAVDFVATLAIHPYADVTLPLVREVGIRYEMIRPLQVDGSRRGGRPPGAASASPVRSGRPPPTPAEPSAAAPPEPLAPTDRASKRSETGGKKKGKST
jgi:hypothetical protein